MTIISHPPTPEYEAAWERIFNAEHKSSSASLHGGGCEREHKEAGFEPGKSCRVCPCGQRMEETGEKEG